MVYFIYLGFAMIISFTIGLFVGMDKTEISKE